MKRVPSRSRSNNRRLSLPRPPETLARAEVATGRSRAFQVTGDQVCGWDDPSPTVASRTCRSR